jgi:hypothetical protein
MSILRNLLPRLLCGLVPGNLTDSDLNKDPEETALLSPIDICCSWARTYSFESPRSPEIVSLFSCSSSAFTTASIRDTDIGWSLTW